jgi:hypothetical protein
MRILSGRVEYLAAVLPTTPMNDKSLSAKIFDMMQVESRTGQSSFQRSIQIVEGFESYLKKQSTDFSANPGFAGPQIRVWIHPFESPGRPYIWKERKRESDWPARSARPVVGGNSRGYDATAASVLSCIVVLAPSAAGVTSIDDTTHATLKSPADRSLPSYNLRQVRGIIF